MHCPKDWLWRVTLAILVGLGADRVGGAETVGRFEILVRQGLVIDGTGRAGMRADVGITAGRIAAVGALDDATAETVVDAQGMIVCPGFIDLHSHADRAILDHRDAENYIRQGVTTLVCGNCGGSPVHLGRFFEQLRQGGTGPNIAMLIGHGSVREHVLGRRNVAPDDGQLAEMKRLVRQAMEDGAVGMSTSLRYGAGAYATTDEIVTLAREVASLGGFYATHMRDEGTRILDALDEALEIGRSAGIPVHVSHHKISSTSVFGLTRITLDKIQQARAAGVDVTLDQYPYGAGSGNLSLYVPQASLSGGFAEYRRRAADARQRAEIAAGVKQLLIRKIYLAGQDPEDPAHTQAALERIQIALAPHDRTIEGKNLRQLLEADGREVTLDAAVQELVDLVGHDVRGINHTLDDRPGGDVDRVMTYPPTCVASDGVVLGMGEGHPHPRSYGCFPRVLGHYVRERKLLTLETAIQKMTSLPAERLGWTDRGRIMMGAWADVVVFDPGTIGDRATFLEPHQQSVGVRDVLVRGRFVLRAGTMTGERPGQPVGLRSGR